MSVPILKVLRSDDPSPDLPVPLNFGLTTLSLDVEALKESSHRFRLCLTLDWGAGFEGSEGFVRIASQQILHKEVPLLGYGPTRIEIAPMRFPQLGTLDLTVNITKPGPHLPYNDARQGRFVARLIDIDVMPYALEEDPRFGVIALARSMARSLGLQGQYMTPERANHLAQEVTGALAEGVGYSFIRLGDGEGRLLGHPHFLTPSELQTQTLNYHFGRVSSVGYVQLYGTPWLGVMMDELKAILERAILEADQVGLPVADYFRNYESDFVQGHYGYAAAMIAAVGLRAQSLNPPHYGTNTFQQLARGGPFFTQVAQAARRVILLGPWDLRQELGAALGVAEIEHIGVQQHFSFAEEKTWGQYPLHMQDTVARLQALGDLRGALVFVGAGLLGKTYCAQIKTQGGVALDIGSVFDSWAGKGRPDAVSAGAQITFEALQRP